MRKFDKLPQLKSKLSFDDLKNYFAVRDQGIEVKPVVVNFYHWSNSPAIELSNDKPLYACDNSWEYVAIAGSKAYLHEITVRIKNPYIALNQVVSPEITNAVIKRNLTGLEAKFGKLDCTIVTSDINIFKDTMEWVSIGCREIVVLNPKDSVVSIECLGQLERDALIEVYERWDASNKIKATTLDGSKVFDPSDNVDVFVSAGLIAEQVDRVAEYVKANVSILIEAELQRFFNMVVEANYANGRENYVINTTLRRCTKLRLLDGSIVDVVLLSYYAFPDGEVTEDELFEKTAIYYCGFVLSPDRQVIDFVYDKNLLP